LGSTTRHGETPREPQAPAPPSGPRPAALRAALVAAGFSAAGVRTALGTRSELLGGSFDGLEHDRALERADPALAALVRLLVLARPVAADAVGTAPVDELAAHGLVAEHGGAVRPLARLVPHGDLLIACDPPHASSSAHVAAVHRPSSTLADLTVRRRVATAVDVGTGNGVQALLCAGHCDRVVATDVNERALAFAEFNAAVNGIGNVELRAGSFFEPVAGQRFDLVVCNPPYVISPESALVYRDGGLPGDAVSAGLVAELPSHLADGGFGSIAISWISGEEPAERPRGWLAGSGCDAWLFHIATDDAFRSALAWNRAADVEPALLAAKVDEWLAYYERLGIERISYGALVVRRRAGDTWFRSARLPAKRLRPASAHLERMFTAATTALLDRPLALVEAARAERVSQRRGGGFALADATVRLEEGIGFHAKLDGAALALVEHLDGSAPLRVRLPALAAALEVDEQALARLAARLLGWLAERGFLIEPVR
jgi:methylase of polypeptide subunit release factors